MTNSVKVCSLKEEVIESVFSCLTKKAIDFGNPEIKQTESKDIQVIGASSVHLLFLDVDGVVTIIVYHNGDIKKHTFTKNLWAFNPKEEVEAICRNVLGLSCFK